MLAEWYSNFPNTGENIFDGSFWSNILEVKAAVNGALEKARNDKLIGAGLSAEVVLYAKPELKAQLAKLADELHFVLITSAASIADFDEAAGVETELAGLRVKVAHSEHEKCERCWHQNDSVGKSAVHPALCSRCIENVEGDGENRRFA